MAPAPNSTRRKDIHVKLDKLRSVTDTPEQWFPMTASTSAATTSSQPVSSTATTPPAMFTPRPTHGSSGNLKIAAIVGTVLVVSLIILVFGGELLRRRTKDKHARPPISTPGSTQPDQLMTQAVEESHEKPEDAGYDERAWNSPKETYQPAIEPLGSRIKQHITRPFKRFISPFARSQHPFKEKESTYSQDIVQSPDSQGEPQSTFDPTFDWDECDDTQLDRLTYPRLGLHSIPEESEVEEYYHDSVSDVALALGLAIQRPLTLVSTSMDLPMSPNFITRSYFSMYSDPDNNLAVEACLQNSLADDSLDELRDEHDNSMSTGTTTHKIQDSRMSLDNSIRSSMTSLDTETDCDADCPPEEVFELRRVQTRSMQMNKATLISFETYGNPRDRRSLHGILGSLSSNPHLQSFTDQYSDLKLTKSVSERSSMDSKTKLHIQEEFGLGVLARSFSDASVSLDSFPSPPDHIPRFPSFL